VLESIEAELQKVKRDMQEQQVSKLKSLQRALNYKHLYEQSLQQQSEQLNEMKNIALMEELTKERGHANQLLWQENDQLKEIQQLLAENALLNETTIEL
jgi:hypothetical protein